MEEKKNKKMLHFLCVFRKEKIHSSVETIQNPPSVHENPKTEISRVKGAVCSKMIIIMC